MKILQIHKPSQDCNTVNPEHVQLDFTPTWCVMTERTKPGESPEEFLERKSEYIRRMNEQKGMNIEGIYLYAIQGMFQLIVSPDDAAREMCYYVRFDYIRPKPQWT